jgi:DNA-binding LytR/AlgR family response regulator
MNFDFSKQEQILFFTTGRKQEWVKASDIMYIMVDLTLSSAYVTYREEAYIFNKQLTEFIAELAYCGFIRANKNTLVNLKFSKGIDRIGKGHAIIMKSGKKILLSRRQYSVVRKFAK